MVIESVVVGSYKYLQIWIFYNCNWHFRTHFSSLQETDQALHKINELSMVVHHFEIVRCMVSRVYGQTWFTINLFQHNVRRLPKEVQTICHVDLLISYNVQPIIMEGRKSVEQIMSVQKVTLLVRFSRGLFIDKTNNLTLVD